MPESPIQRIVIQRLVHQLVSQRLVERAYNQPLIGNVERGAYVECMVELALSELRPFWSLTETWAAWDLQQQDTSARIEVKQSAALQTWSSTAPTKPPKFDIAPRSGYYDDGGSLWVAPETPQRFADVYIMAWHDERNAQIADHRQPDQWQFYVVAEERLPSGQKSISLNPLASLSRACSYAELASEVEDVLGDVQELKATRP